MSDIPNSDPLPAAFDHEQRAVDALLAASAKMQIAAIPTGLAQRVFDASIAQAGARDMTIDPLPAEFEGQLHTIDAMLSMSASPQGDATPPGLSQRVFEASVAHLPGVAVKTTTAPLRLVDAGAQSASIARLSVRWSIWQRLSLAASVAIVGGIALWAIMQQPTAPSPGSRPGAAAGDTHFAAEISSQFNTLNNLTDDLSDFENEVAYLLDATEVRSVAELSSDFDLLVQRMDM